MERHAVYVTCETKQGDRITFRVGQPTDWRTAGERWQRLADRQQGFNGVPARAIRVRFDGKTYTARRACIEVRSVDSFGRGLGADRHHTAFPVPYRAVKSAI